MQDMSTMADEGPFSIIEVVFLSTAGAQYTHRYFHHILSDDRCCDLIDQKKFEIVFAIRTGLAGEGIFRAIEVALRRSS